ncbi:hypothetical protein HK096_010380 [Nowakowskiella sp. JEL0078]|nr:hypothetical protein HK096_010380 [Nowakowskiella sp. JEL0078]
MVGLEDPPKSGVREAIGKMRKSGIKVVMSIARRTNIITGTPQGIEKNNATTVILGEQVPFLTDKDWENLFGADDPTDDLKCSQEVIFARALPQHKLEIVRRAQALGHIVGVTGDGVNDAAALKKADLGIAMNKTGSDVSKQAASMILLDDDFASTVTGISEGRLIFNNLKKSITYTLSHIIPEVIPYMMSVLIPLPIALTASQVLMVDLGFELFTTLSFAWDPPEDINLMMKMKPRQPVTRESIQRIKEINLKKQSQIENPKTLNWFDKWIQKARKSLETSKSIAKSPAGQKMNEFDYYNDQENLLGSITQLNDSEATDKRLNSRWRKYLRDFLLILDRRYWEEVRSDAQLIISNNSGETLVDLEVLMWSYVEAGLIECGGAFLTYFAVLYSFGITAMDAREAQKTGIYFKPHSPDLILLNGQKMV